jgi:ATP-dependent exoDNAse (exonuclease V) beta subunit
MRRAARTDLTAASLVKLARQMGAVYVALNSVVDGLLWWRGRWYVIDWKSPKGTLTEAQGRIVASGAKIEFVSSEQQLKDLLGVR